jgi:hypothetical protein
LELTTFESPLVSPKPLPRMYKRKVTLEHDGEELFTYIFYQNLEVLLYSTLVAVRFPSLIEELRRSKEQGGVHLHLEVIALI